MQNEAFTHWAITPDPQIMFKIIFICLKVRIRYRDIEIERSLCCFTPQMAVTARLGQTKARIQELRAGLQPGWQGLGTEATCLCFPRCFCRKLDDQTRAVRSEPGFMWEAGVTGSGLMHCITTPAPHVRFT